MTIEELLKTKIKWKNHPTNIHFFYHEANGKIILLRMNNFPDEPFFTIINGLEILDIDDEPSCWILER